MNSQARNTVSGMGIPGSSGRPSRPGLASLTANDAGIVRTLRQRIGAADLAGDDALSAQLRATLALREDGTLTLTLTLTEPTTPPPTGDGRMVTVDQAESPKPSHRRIGEKKLRHVRVETPLWVLACQKAEAEGLGISEVVRQLLRRYVDEDIDGEG